MNKRSPSPTHQHPSNSSKSQCSSRSLSLPPSAPCHAHHSRRPSCRPRARAPPGPTSSLHVPNLQLPLTSRLYARKASITTSSSPVSTASATARGSMAPPEPDGRTATGSRLPDSGPTSARPSQARRAGEAGTGRARRPKGAGPGLQAREAWTGRARSHRLCQGLSAGEAGTRPAPSSMGCVAP